LAAALAILAVTIPGLSQPEDTASLQSQTPAAASNIVIGFVGGLAGDGDPHQGPVRLAQQIRHTVPKDTYIQVFENRRRKLAYNTVIRLLDANHDGKLSAEEKSGARIVLFGYSWGAAAAVLLARDLQREGIPVLLTAQVDSVAKMGKDDSVIPDNVAAAVNFYQPHGIIHGRKKITAADPAKTQILGNYRMDYRKNPIVCPDVAWVDRLFVHGHIQSECDPRVWSQIGDMVKLRLSPSTTAAAVSAPANPQP
jgi:pimeloyl-ACP methyl ester carboxylesterase